MTKIGLKPRLKWSHESVEPTKLRVDQRTGPCDSEEISVVSSLCPNFSLATENNLKKVTNVKFEKLKI